MVLKKRTRGFIFFITISVILIAASSFYLMNWERFLNKGLDLEGGVYVLLEAETTGDEEKDRDAVERAMTIIRSRIDELGVTEPVLQREGERRIRIELPGIEDQAQAMEAIGRTAMLTFQSPDGEVLLTGANLETAHFTRGQYNEPIVTLEFDSEGAQMFAEATQRHLNEPLSIYLDDELVSAPMVQSVITDGNAIITGIPSAEEANTIAMLLRSGALPVDLSELETRSIGPLLGENALGLSFTAGMIGLLLVLVFMVVVYRFAGLVADISLVVYLGLVFLMLSGLNATITLPGLAGLILSIGMAVDANVLIFERIKEEIRDGKTMLTAINSGFDRAFGAILDANITTIIAALVLLFIASGPVRGFAVVLLVGVICSLLAALVLTRFLLRLAARSKMIKSSKYLGIKEA